MEPQNDCKYDVNGFYSSNKTQVLLDLIYKISATFLLFLKNHPAYIMPHCNQKKQQVKILCGSIIPHMLATEFKLY